MRRRIRREWRVIDQIASVRHQHMRCKAAVDGDPEMMGRNADILVAGFTGRALSATDPGIDGYFCPGFDIGIRARALDLPAISWPRVNGSVRPARTSSFLSPPSTK